MKYDLTSGKITKPMLMFAFPMILGNLLQQLYNVADTLVVSQFLGTSALAAVGTAFTLMIFITSIILGLCMGSGIYFAMCFGEKNQDKLQTGIFHAFVMIAWISILLNIIIFLFLPQILQVLQVPIAIQGMMKDYLWIIILGILATFLYNFYACLLRSIGNSLIPLTFLGISAVLNIVLDLLFVLVFHWGIQGAAWATVIAQYIAGIGIMIYTILRCPHLRMKKEYCVWKTEVAKVIFRFSFITCLQQSVMNFGILMVQGLINSFGTIVMAAFAAAVKIDSFAYMPLQDFGNAFSTYTAQNHGAQAHERINKGIKSALTVTIVFSIIISSCIWIFAKPLMLLFIQPQETAILTIGIEYLRIEGAFYIGIGILFLLYGYYRAIQKPSFSLLLTVISLGTRVLLAYGLSSIAFIGVKGIWWSVPIGWILADITGLWYGYYLHKKKTTVYKTKKT